ncbi:MAG: trypsin-like peptidase domain-containing protein [Clostridia bacterium]
MSDNENNNFDGNDEKVSPEQNQPVEQINKNVSNDIDEDSNTQPMETDQTSEQNALITEKKQEENQTHSANDFTYSWSSSSAIRKKSKKNKKLVAAIVAITIVFTSLAFMAGMAASSGKRDDTVSQPMPDTSETSKPKNTNTQGTVSLEPISDLKQQTVSAIYEKCSKSCATIYVTTSRGYAIGSGFVVDKDGHIVTNSHVVENGTKIEVIFYNDERYTAELIGADSLTDIAVLKIKADNLVPIALGDSSQVKVGDMVVAIGTPYSMTLAGSLSSGYISGVNRSVDVSNDYGTVTKTMKLLQTDTTINPGNSGGPLINIYGQVIGINTLKLMDVYEGIGFAIPMSNAISIINSLIRDGTVTDVPSDLVTATPRLNLTVATISDQIKSQCGLPDTVPDGVVVTAVARNSSIYKAGLELYDIITEFNGAKIKNINDLSAELNKYTAGQKVTVKIYRTLRNGTGTYSEITFSLDAAT